MKNLKRILFLAFALLFLCSIPISSVEAASKVTAKKVLKDALYSKQGKNDLVVVSINVSADIKRKEMMEITKEKMHGYRSVQVKGKDFVCVQHYKDTFGDFINESHYYETYDSKKQKRTSLYSEGDTNTYDRADFVGVETDLKAYDYKNMFKYMSDIKFVKKDTLKNGQKAYCVSAKFDCASYLGNREHCEEVFTSNILAFYPYMDNMKNVYAKVTAYINQKTGKLISMKFNMNDYVKNLEKEAFQLSIGKVDNDKDYSIQVNSTKSYMTIEVNPKNYKKITMPSNYTQYKFDYENGIESKIIYEKNKKVKEMRYSEEGFESATYDKNGKLVSEIKTKYADEYSISKQYKNGKLTNTTKIDRVDSTTVSNVNQLMNAIGTYNLIYLEEGEYNLSDLEALQDIGYLANVYANSTYDGVEYVLHAVNHLTLIGKGNVSIVIEPRYSNVINLDGCRDITFKNLTIGHTKEKGYCEGGVLHITNSDKITIDSCNLYGCGTYGIITDYVDNLKMVNTQIYECTYGIMELTNTTNAQFSNCKFKDNVGYDMIFLDGCSSITYDKCQIYNNTVDYEVFNYFIVSNNNQKITFKNCDFHDNTKECELTNDDGIQFKDCKLQ
ncbi:MAG: right-handed parallel beta-helix repeat-containing protein [Clostridiales bacterium]|nr:right-handed parallel beta-helix repeat-containing protein [Clostridiales bacterium]